MSLVTYLLAAISTLPTFHEDRGERFVAQKHAQAELIANAISDAAESAQGWPGSKRELATLLLTIAWYETRLSLRIHDGRCHPYECDHGKARGLWQLHAHASLPRERWLTVAGLTLEATRSAAAEAAQALVRSRYQCTPHGPSWVAATILAYAGRGCGGHLRDLDARVRTFRRLLALQPKKGDSA